MHGWLAISLMALVALHVAAALHHHFIRKDKVLRSML
ncbi:cytochrome b/b6 domain-containing protein [Idiomarina sp. X4]|nr:cytochrome b/b6 domain-containing protein [Idiomarina sp. X4]